MARRQRLARLRQQIAREERRRALQRKQHEELVKKGLVCSAHHFGCTETLPHYHLMDGDVVLTKKTEGEA